MSEPFMEELDQLQGLFKRQLGDASTLPPGQEREKAFAEVERILARQQFLLRQRSQLVIDQGTAIRELEQAVAEETARASRILPILRDALTEAQGPQGANGPSRAPARSEDRLAEMAELAPDAPKPGLRVRKSRAFEDIADEYLALFKQAQPKPEHVVAVDSLVARIRGQKDRYDAVGTSLDIPWHLVGLIHAMESGCDFTRHLHNGDPLDQPTRHEPRGRPPGWTGGNWEDSARDALTCIGFAHRPGDWSLSRQLWRLERYNGFGYRDRGLPSPYLWSFSKLYEKGKYVADGVFDANKVSKQPGAAVLLFRLVEKGDVRIEDQGVVVLDGVSRPTAPRWLEIARAEIGVKEISGSTHNPRILEYIASCDLAQGYASDETPWCSAFVNFCLVKAGLAGTRGLAARSWLTWGRPVELADAVPGDVVVFWRGNPESRTGHVGFFDGRAGTDILVLGGNQANRVNVSPYPRDRLLGVRRPA